MELAAMTTNIGPTWTVLAEVRDERSRQDARWGQQDHPDGTGQYPEVTAAMAAVLATEHAAEGGYLDWLHILREEVAEAFAETDPAALRGELLQVAAVAVAWIEAIDRRSASRTPDSPCLDCGSDQCDGYPLCHIPDGTL